MEHIRIVPDGWRRNWRTRAVFWWEWGIIKTPLCFHFCSSCQLVPLSLWLLKIVLDLSPVMDSHRAKRKRGRAASLPCLPAWAVSPLSMLTPAPWVEVGGALCVLRHHERRWYLATGCQAVCREGRLRIYSEAPLHCPECPRTQICMFCYSKRLLQ